MGNGPETGFEPVTSMAVGPDTWPCSFVESVISTAKALYQIELLRITHDNRPHGKYIKKQSIIDFSKNDWASDARGAESI